MRTFRALQCVCVVVSMSMLLALAGCGSSGKTTTTESSVAATPTRTSASAVTAATYNINLTHVTGASGASNAAGVAVLSVKSPSDQLCWSISPIKAFTVSRGTTTPTIITIQSTPAGSPSTPGFPLGMGYEPSSCIAAPAVFLRRLEANPKMYFLSIYNTANGDAVRGQM